MEATVVRNLHDLHSSEIPSLPSTPARAVHRHYPYVATPEEHELTRVPTTASAKSKTSTTRMHQGPPAAPITSSELSRNSSATARDLESSRSASPVHGETEVLQSWHSPYKNRFRVAACSIINLMNGMIDGASGAVIPYMETYYDIKYGTVSLIFVGLAVGFIIFACLLDYIRHHFGGDRVLMLSQIFYALGLIPMVCGAPFPLIVVSYFLFGAGCAIFLAAANIYCGSLSNGTSILGVVHGSYGIGATIAPLISTAIITHGEPWSRYYILPLAIAAFSNFFTPWAFWKYVSPEDANNAAMAEANPDEKKPNKLLAMFRALRTKVVLLGSLFIFSYQGSEVSISGWVISFLIKTRKGDPGSVGYVTAGFWGGITLGRFLLSGLTHQIGEKRFVYGAVIGSAILQGLVWGVPHIIGDAVAVSIVGLLLGPVYPCSMAVMMAAMTRQEKLSGVGVITAFGSSGGAIAPFVTGILAQAVGTWVLHPIVIGLFCVMVAAWFGVPSIRKRAD